MRLHVGDVKFSRALRDGLSDGGGGVVDAWLLLDGLGIEVLARLEDDFSGAAQCRIRWSVRSRIFRRT